MRVGPSGQDVDVSRCLGAAADAANDDQRHHGALAAQVFDEQPCGFCRDRKEMASRLLFALRTRLQNQLFLLRSHSFQLADASIPAGGFELVNTSDAQLRVQLSDRFWADALKVEQVENRRRELVEQFAVIARVAALGDFANLQCEIFTDARYGSELVACTGSQPFGSVGDRVGGIAVCADFERVLALDLEQVGDLRKNACDGGIFHEWEQKKRRLASGGS
jgi:hypothetical protein